MSPEDRVRRRNARVVNERIKLIATLCNTLSVATFITLVIARLANGIATPLWQIALATMLAAMLHGLAQTVLRFWKSED